ncbi:MAG: ABC transporter permease [Polyangiaceae bacterium]|nr:ABC transporter permease [Polyangiaceae bacterium]
MAATPSASSRAVKEKLRASDDVVAHLVWHDVKRNLRLIRALPVLAVAIVLAYQEVEWRQKLGDFQDFLYYAEGAFSRNHFWLFKVIPLVAGVMGGSLAAERRAGITLGIFAKGVSRWHYIIAKMLGAAASSALITLVAILAFFAYVFTMWIPGRAPYLEPVWIEGPVKSLFAYSPFAHDLLVAAMLITAAAALSLVGVLAGLIVANEYVAIAATPIFTIISVVIMRQVSDALNPEGYLMLDYDWSLKSLPHWLLPYLPFLYWTAFSLIIAALCKWIIAKKEIA